ncbi:MAG TPA: hypothetical protein VHX40_06135 [Acidimicrobiales bacterium]|nr:hypothetical protein [Acidimicrobiales bacterium]
MVVAAGAALALGAGPAVAWDLSTQPPRAKAPSAWPRPSPWLSAAKQAKAAAADLARVYVPRVEEPDAGSDEPLVPAPGTTTAAASATGPRIISIPIPYRVPPRR